jgi:hypothetical protein
MGRFRRFAAGGAVVVVAVTWWWLARDEPPMDEALLESVRPAIHEQLPRSREVGRGGMLTGSRQDLRPRWFCAERAIEIWRQGTDIRVGLIAHCAEYGRNGDALVSGTGMSGAMAVTVVGEPGAYRLSTVEWARDGAAHVASIERIFTPAGARVALHAEQGGHAPDTATLEDEARRHFGLSPTARVLPG